MGVRISWLMLARNSLLARLAASAASLARRRSSSALLAVGDVAGDADDPGGRAGGVAVGAERHELVPLLAADRHDLLEGLRDASGQDAVGVGVDHGDRLGVEQLDVGPADDPDDIGAEAPSPRLVDQDEAMVEVVDEQGVGNPVDDSAEQRVALAKLRGPRFHLALDPREEVLQLGLTRGHGAHLAGRSEARDDEDGVLEDDPTGVLEPAPGARRRDAEDRPWPEDAAEVVVERDDGRGGEHDPRVAVDGQEGERAEDVEVSLDPPAREVNQQGPEEHLRSATA